jgi:hypothetical protein
MSSKTWMFVAAIGVLAGCSAPEAEEEADGDGQAITAGSRWRSPLEVGEYDARDMTLTVFTWADRQRVTVSQSPTGDCEGTVDVTNGRAIVKGINCELELENRSGWIQLDGNISGRPVDRLFEPRGPNALVGNYVTLDGAELDIESSAAGTFTFSLQSNNRTLATRARAKRSGSNIAGDYLESYTADALRACNFIVGRERNEFTIFIYKGTSADCPATGTAYFRSR